MFVRTDVLVKEAARMKSNSMSCSVLPSGLGKSASSTSLATPSTIKQTYVKVLNFVLSRTRTTSFRTALTQLVHKA